MGYMISLAVGFAIGLIYWLLRVQSPAPPLIALAGLLGMVLGEHAIPVVKAQFFAEAPTVQVASDAKEPPTQTQNQTQTQTQTRSANKGD